MFFLYIRKFITKYTSVTPSCLVVTTSSIRIKFFDVFDFSPYADREPSFRDNPYGIEPLVLISRTIDERVDLQLSYTKVKDNNIDEIERLAESFYKWVEKEVAI